LKPILRTSALVTILFLAIQFIASAAATRRWVQGGREEFLKGNPESASISSDGAIQLPPSATRLFDSSQQFVWALAVNSAGRLFVAGGTDGIIYDARGNPVYDSEKPEIRALAVGPDDLIYFATSPSGSVYRLNSAGAAEKFFTPSSGGSSTERYIWDLAFDRAGNLYVATGIEGRLYRVGPDGNGSVVFDSDQVHITSLAVDPQGNVFFGSDPGGHIFRLDPSGKTFVLFDSPLREISDIAVRPDGSLFATAISGSTQKETKTATGVEKTAITASALEVGDAGASVSISNKTDGGESNGEISALYHLSRDGTAAAIWTSKTEVAYSLSVDGDGAAIVGTGPKGRLISVKTDGTFRVLRRLEGMQVTALYYSSGQLYAGVSNLGIVYRLTSQFAERGSFISQVKDCGTVSSFGALRWRAEVPDGSAVRLMTRSGNTSEPDNTWSEWSKAYTDPRNSVISSPAARFIQWKAELSTTEPGLSPVLKSVSLFYLQNNLKPRVKSITVLPPGIFFKPPSPPDPLIEAIPAEVAAELKTLGLNVISGSSRGQVVYSREMRSLSWAASDSNDDELIYRLLIRNTGGSEWSPLAERVRDNYYCFDTRSLGDGEYVVRVEASDSLSNPPDKASVGSLDTRPFLIDNTPPTIEGLSATASSGAATISFETADSFSAIKAIRIKVGAGPWRPVLPDDGIADSRRERVTVQLDGLGAGRHAISVQAQDELHNIGSGSAEVTIR